jgi:hypothetical protein
MPTKAQPLDPVFWAVRLTISLLNPCRAHLFSDGTQRWPHFEKVSLRELAQVATLHRRPEGSRKRPAPSGLAVLSLPDYGTGPIRYRGRLDCYLEMTAGPVLFSVHGYNVSLLSGVFICNPRMNRASPILEYPSSPNLTSTYETPL